MERKDRFLEIGSSSSASSPSLKRKRGSGDESPEVDFDHDVFISFRGEDTRTNFTSHVYDALCRKHIKAFIDSEDLRKGHEVRGSLLKAIETSKLYLIIFSPDYGSSRWCLMELEKIFQCSKQPHGKKMVIPVFYKVEPTHVRHQTGSFKDAFIEHEAEEEKEQVLKWRVALKEVAGLSGFLLKEHKLETEFINEIVEAILKEFPLPTPSKGLVGIDPHIKKVLSLLCVDSSEVRSVGIWGMGGIGKTTIAEAVFHSIDHAHFDGYYFLQNDVVNLRWMDLSHSHNLIETPDLSKAKNLECMVFENCEKLTRLPKYNQVSGIGSSLEYLLMGQTGVEEVPSSVQFLTGLHRLYLIGNHKLRSISDSISRLKSLRELFICGCKLLSFIPVLPTSLERLQVTDCPSLETVSPIGSQSQLEHLTLLGCRKLDHESLTNIMGHISFKVKLQLRKDFKAVIQGSKISEWFPHQNVRVGSSITLPILPSNLHDGININTNFSPGIALSHVLEFNPLYIDDKNYFSVKLEVRAHPQTDDQDLPPAETEIIMNLKITGYTIRPKSDLVLLWSTPTPSQFLGEMLSPKYSSMSFQFTPSLPQVKVQQCAVYLAF